MFKIIFNTLLGLVLIFVWLQFVSLNEIKTNLATVKPASLLPIFFFLWLSVAIRAFRLQLVLSKVRKISLIQLLFLNGAATILNFLIPIRGGEIAKSFYLSQNYDLPVGKTIVWIFLDRFLDFLVVFIVGALLLTLVPTNLGSDITQIVIFGSIILVLVAYLMVFQTKIARILFNFFKHFLVFNSIKIYFDRVFEFFIDAFSIFKRPPWELLIIFL